MEEERKQIERQTAYIVGINEIHASKYIKSKGEWDPNYFVIRGQNVSRVSLMGVVISVSNESEKTFNFSIDDGEGNISIRIFDTEKLNPQIEVGDILLIIGKAREYNDEKYITPEIIKEIKNELWLEVRKKEITRLKANSPKETTIIDPITKTKEPVIEVSKETPQEEKVEETSVTNATDKIFATIKELDSGEGADYEEVLNKNPNSDNMIKNLMNEGEIFEIKPGRLKVLE